MTDDPFVFIDPLEPSVGAVVTAARQSRVPVVHELQTNRRQVRRWRVRGVPSHQLPLWGGPEIVLNADQRAVEVNENPLTIHLHFGGRNVVFFDLVGDDETGRLIGVEVEVETELPGDAFLLAKQPLHQLLDVLARNWELPLGYQSFELWLPGDEVPLAWEFVLPERRGLSLGPLGGFQQTANFAVYDAIYREALLSPSPFYRLLCACRLYEGTNRLRRWLRELSDRFGVKARLPADPQIDRSELIALGAGEALQGVRTASDLFDRYKMHRNAIAHFLVEGREGDAHVYLADGRAWRDFSLGATILMRYANRAISELRSFYQNHFDALLSSGSIGADKNQRDQFVIRG